MRFYLIIIITLLFISCQGDKKTQITEIANSDVSDEKEAQIPIERVSNLEVMTKNLGIMSWYEAKEACAGLGDGWRLPTFSELVLIEKNMNIESESEGQNGYWTSTETRVNRKGAWIINNGYRQDVYKTSAHNVRAVKQVSWTILPGPDEM